MKAQALQNQNILSPESGSGSFIYSVFVHGFIALSVISFLKINWHPSVLPVDKIIDMTYESFDRPPEPAQEIRHVAKVVAPETPPETKPVLDNSPKEIQDEHSDIAGTQAAAKPVATQASDGTGTAATTPFYKIKPKYPKAALQAGTEGWVLMKLDINEKGEVENIRVVDGEQRNLFQSEAKRAVEQWKYRPFTDQSGKVFRKLDHQVRVEFKLQDAS